MTDIVIAETISLRSLFLDALGANLGRYFFPNRPTPVPAIAVIPDKVYGNDYPPEGTVISGIEVLIIKPFPSAIERLSFDSYRPYKWDIQVRQWDGNGDIRLCAELMINALQENQYKFTNPVYVAPDLETGILPSCRIGVIKRYFRIYQEVE